MVKTTIVKAEIEQLIKDIKNCPGLELKGMETMDCCRLLDEIEHDYEIPHIEFHYCNFCQYNGNYVYFLVGSRPLMPETIFVFQDANHPFVPASVELLYVITRNGDTSLHEEVEKFLWPKPSVEDLEWKKTQEVLRAVIERHRNEQHSLHWQ